MATVAEPFDTQMLDYPVDLDVPMDSEHWQQREDEMDDDVRLIADIDNDLEVEMTTYIGSEEYEMSDAAHEEREDIEVIDDSRTEHTETQPNDSTNSAHFPSSFQSTPTMSFVQLDPMNSMELAPLEFTQSDSDTILTAEYPTHSFPTLEPSLSEFNTVDTSAMEGTPSLTEPAGGEVIAEPFSVTDYDHSLQLPVEDSFSSVVVEGVNPIPEPLGVTAAEEVDSNTVYQEGEVAATSATVADEHPTDTVADPSQAEDNHEDPAREVAASAAYESSVVEGDGSQLLPYDYEQGTEGTHGEIYASEVHVTADSAPQYEPEYQATQDLQEENYDRPVEIQDAPEPISHDDVNPDTHGMDADALDPVPPVNLYLPYAGGGHVFLFNQPEHGSSATPSTSEVTLDTAELTILQHSSGLYYESLSELFKSLRQDDLIKALPDLSTSEIVLDAYDLQLIINEDNTFARKVSLHDLHLLHDASNLPGVLNLRLQLLPSRLSVRYNVLYETLVGPLLDTVEDTVYSDDTSREVDYQQYDDPNYVEVAHEVPLTQSNQDLPDAAYSEAAQLSVAEHGDPANDTDKHDESGQALKQDNATHNEHIELSALNDPTIDPAEAMPLLDEVDSSAEQLEETYDEETNPLVATSVGKTEDELDDTKAEAEHPSVPSTDGTAHEANTEEGDQDDHTNNEEFEHYPNTLEQELHTDLHVPTNDTEEAETTTEAHHDDSEPLDNGFPEETENHSVTEHADDGQVDPADEANHTAEDGQAEEWNDVFDPDADDDTTTLDDEPITHKTATALTAKRSFHDLDTEPEEDEAEFQGGSPKRARVA